MCLQEGSLLCPPPPPPRPRGGGGGGGVLIRRIQMVHSKVRGGLLRSQTRKVPPLVFGVSPLSALISSSSPISLSSIQEHSEPTATSDDLGPTYGGQCTPLTQTGLVTGHKQKRWCFFCVPSFIFQAGCVFWVCLASPAFC